MSQDDHQHLAVGDGLIECVDQFLYLGSMIVTENNLDAELDVRIAKASTGFWSITSLSVFVICTDQVARTWQ